MPDWKQFENETTADLIQFIKWKDQRGYTEDAKAAFIAFCFRFRADIIKKCEVICNRWKYDIDTARELSQRVFEKFWRYPNYDDTKRKEAKDYDTGVKLYLYKIAQNELINIYKESTDHDAYTGDEKIIYDLPEINLENMQPERRKELEEKFDIIKLALDRLSEKHRIIYLTYEAHKKQGKNLPKHLRESLRRELNLAQGTIRYYKFEAEKTITDYLKICQKVKKI